MDIGFIGGGNMANAILGGLIKQGYKACDIFVSDKNTDALEKLKTTYGVNITDSNISVAERAEILFICVKPNIISLVLDEIKTQIKIDTTVVSIAAGTSIKKLEECLSADNKIIRVMPNTPAFVGEGMSAVCANEKGTDSLGVVRQMLECIGKCEIVQEKLMDTVTAVSGSSPAYVFMLIEAMADGAVQGGMTRDVAYKFAAQAVLGSAKMVLDTGKHPGELKDMVCSPGGTTIEAVAVLEKNGFRNSIIKAMEACRKKSEKM